MADARVESAQSKYQVYLEILTKYKKGTKGAGGLELDEKETKRVQSQLKNAQREVAATKAAIQKGMIRPIQRFKMEFLGIMFFGMALQRFFGNFLKSIMATYKQVTEGQDAMSKSTLRLSAAWEFFKFSVMEALEPFIIMFSQLAVKVLDFISANPSLSKMIGLFALLGLVIGSVLFIVGTLALGINSIIALNPMVLLVIGVIMAVVGAVLSLIQVFNLIPKILQVAWYSVKYGLIQAEFWFKAFGIKMQHLFELFRDVIKFAFLKVFIFLADHFTGFIENIISGLNAVRKGFNALFGTDIKKFELADMVALATEEVDKLGKKIMNTDFFLEGKLAALDTEKNIKEAAFTNSLPDELWVPFPTIDKLFSGLGNLIMNGPEGLISKQENVPASNSTSVNVEGNIYGDQSLIDIIQRYLGGTTSDVEREVLPQ